jgi:hypothetical protein
MRAALLVMGLIFISSQIASAYTVSPITVDPKGALLQCEPVNATFVIGNPHSDTNGYPGAEDIELFTELDSPVWSLILLIDGEQKAFPDQKSSHVLLSNWNLTNFNKNSSHEQIQINLAGNAPLVPQTSNNTLVRISQLGADNNSIPRSVLSVERVVVALCCESPYCPSFLEQKIELQQFRALIDQNSSRGADTSVAEVKYNEAQQKIDSAGSMESTHYVQIFSDLNAATQAIADGEQALDRAWAEKEVADAQEKVSQIDAITGWFKANSSTRDNALLPAIVAKREVAVSYISIANDEIGNGNYNLSRLKAKEAYEIANKTYTDALTLQRGVTCCGPDLFPPLFFLAGTFVLILILIGVIWWKKFLK